MKSNDENKELPNPPVDTNPMKMVETKRLPTKMVYMSEKDKKTSSEK